MKRSSIAIGILVVVCCGLLVGLLMQRCAWNAQSATSEESAAQAETAAGDDSAEEAAQGSEASGEQEGQDKGQPSDASAKGAKDAAPVKGDKGGETGKGDQADKAAQGEQGGAGDKPGDANELAAAQAGDEAQTAQQDDASATAKRDGGPDQAEQGERSRRSGRGPGRRGEGRPRPREGEPGQGPEDKPGPGETKPGEEAQAAQAEVKEDPNDPLVAINFKDMEMKEVIPLIAEWTDKRIIPDEAVMGQKLTIYAHEKVRRSEALALIYASLQTKGYMPEVRGETLFLKPASQAKLMSVPTIGPDEPLALFEDKEQLAQKFFQLNNYSPARLQQVILPLMAEYGYCTADESTRSLVVIETIGNLQRIERIISQLDTEAAEPMLLEVCEVHHEDPAEIVQLLKILLADLGKSRGGTSPAGDRAVVVGAGDMPIVLIAEPKRKWIIAKAAPAAMEQVKTWIKRLDQEGTAGTEFTPIQVDYVSVRELAEQVNRMMERLPGYEQDLKANVRVLPLEQNNTLMVFGSVEKRELIKKLVSEVDLPPTDYERQTFELKHADATEVKGFIEELYSDEAGQDPYSRYGYGYGYGGYSRRGRGGGTSERDKVRVIDYPTLKRVTVVASPEKLKEIAAQIAEWDKPLDIESVRPMIVELHNSDPVKMAQLLSTLFTESESQMGSFYDYFFRGRGREEQKTIVGPLYGQLSFEAVPDTKKIIVISKIPEAYEVVRGLIEELDRQEAAELPMIVTLKYADPEDLCERLNALLNKPGTPATIRLAERQLSSTGSAATNVEESQASSSQQQGRNENEQANVYTPWWNSDRQRADEEQPLSNIIGKIRFIPDRRSKAVLVVSPAEYLEHIKSMIEVLDQPADQVMVKAVVVRVTHEAMTSLGLELSSNSAAFGTLGEDAVAAFGFLEYAEQKGSVRLGANMDVAAMVDFLVKTTNARVLNQPTLWAKDNEEAEMFRGRMVPRIKGSVNSTDLTAIRQDVQFIPVGVTLRLRPNITPEKSIDLAINLIISELESELLLGNTVTSETNTTTHMIVDNGETLMLSGILFQNDREVERKIPLLGDLPLLGPLFRHYDVEQSNDEMLIFITPTVVGNETGAAQAEAQRAREKMERSLRQLSAAVPQGDKDEDKDEADASEVTNN